MEVSEAISTRLEIREYAQATVDERTKRSILDAGRLAPSGKNIQHWRFVLLDEADDIDTVADLSDTGDWVRDADFAVAILTDPTYPYHDIDAGRAVTHMQLRGWELGIGSCIFTGYDDGEMRRFLEADDELTVSLIAGFGRPTKPIDRFEGRKRRRPLEAIAFRNRFGHPYDAER